MFCVRRFKVLLSQALFAFVMGRGSRRGRGGAAWCGAPRGCPVWGTVTHHAFPRLVHEEYVYLHPWAATRAPTPHPLLSRPYASERLSKQFHEKPTCESTLDPGR